jgi:branched-chain amino acid transport system substrate-binding protein
MTAGIQKILIAAAATFLINHAGAQTAVISDDVVKIGVLTDMSGQFSHESGEGGHRGQDGR